MSKRTRRRHTPDQKAALVRQHVVDKKPVSEICSAAQIQPSVFYKWERDLLAAAPALFAGRRAPSREQELEARSQRWRRSWLGRTPSSPWSPRST
jgi:transposase-like protein